MVDPPQRVKGQNKRPGADVEAGGSDKPAATSSPSSGAASAPRSGGGGGGGGGLGLIRNILIVLVVVGVIVLIVFLLRDNDKDDNRNNRFPTLAPTRFGDPPGSYANTLYDIRQRQVLRCGVPNEYIGFGATNATSGQYEGFDVDLCRAVAVAIFGVDGRAEFVPLDSFNRFTSLQNGYVDMLARVTTHTMERDVFEENARAGFSFSTPYLYNGLTFAGDPNYVSCADNMTIGMLVDDRQCEDTRICVVGGTTTRDALYEANPRANLVERNSIADVYTGLVSNFCNVIAGEQMVVAESVLRNEGYRGRYAIGRFTHSKDPLALVTREDDPVFSDFVNWVLMALMSAEEHGITKRGVESGQQSGRLIETRLFGDDYSKMFRNVIRTVGNYGEIYERNLELILPRPMPDLINKGNSPLIYAFPFGSLSNTPGVFQGSSTSLTGMNNQNMLTSGGRLERILNQGSLKCGININRDQSKQSDLFAKIGQMPYSGFDVDFCQAVAAAIFNGDSSKVQYVFVSKEDRFKALASNTIDVLSQTEAEYEFDVRERSTNRGYSFTQPVFYHGMAVGGIPPYGVCVDNEDHRAGQCVDLKICARRGTEGKFLDILRNEVFPGPFVNPIDNSDNLGDALRSGDCNAVAGTIEEVSVSAIRRNYQGPYEVGMNRFSKGPQALVTAQDDRQWADFVFWVVSALFYADEEGITQFTSSAMPSVQLFGPRFVFMFRHAVAAVGSYGEIYNRHFILEAPRGGPHASNKLLEGAQIYPLAGIVNE